MIAVRRARLAALAATLCAALCSSGQALAPPALSARCAVVLDQHTGRVLYARAARERRPMASLTKIMTALLFLEATDPYEKVRVSERAARVGEATGFLRPGDVLLASDIAHLMLLRSANDAATAAAEHVAGSVERFVQQMNRRAAQLGLADTRYANPHGLDQPGHYSSALDVARLARVALANPRFSEIVRRSSWTLSQPLRIAGKRTIENTNKLLCQRGDVNGVKTGMTEGAGWCLCASAARGDEAYIAVVLDSAARFADCAALLDWAFANFALRTVLAAGQTRALAPVAGGTAAEVAVAPTETIAALLPRDEPLPPAVYQPALLHAPVRAGDPAGSFLVVCNGKRYLVPAVAAQSVGEGVWQVLVRWPWLGAFLCWACCVGLLVGRVVELCRRCLGKVVHRRAKVARVRGGSPQAP